MDLSIKELNIEVCTYVGEFYVALEKQRNERRRHIEHGDVECLDNAGKLNRAADDEDKRIALYDVEAVLKTCTPIQRRWFNLYHVHGFTLEEIGRMEGCDYSSAKESINAVSKKLKKFFSDTP